VSKTRQSLTTGLATVLLGKKELDRNVLERLEEVLLTSDMGLETAGRLLTRVRERARRNELSDLDRVKQVLKEEIHQIMSRRYPPPAWESQQPGVILFLGVNGTGKTTSIGKLASRFSGEGKRVLLAAGDTFRAAAAEQLGRWAERTGCEIVARPEGSDPSGVMFQAVERAQAGKFDLLLCDTAGRLHTKHNLMEELKKIKRVISKSLPRAPHETWLVLDANTGQNAIHQTREFHQAVGLTGLIVTKLDGTARGGVVVGIVNEFDLPIRYIGVGESAQDLEPFDPLAFADNLLE
jgi:fused signal recognition particle receptor